MSEPTVHLDDALLIDLVHGFARDPEGASALAHLDGCAACEARFREIAATHQRGRARFALRNAANATQAHPIRATGEARARRPGPLSFLLAAAGIVVVAALALLLEPDHHRRALDTPPSWLPKADPGVLTRDVDQPAPDSLLVAGLEAYSRHDLEASSDLLRRAHPSAAMEPVRGIYLANAELQRGHAAEALALLRGVRLDQIPDPWRGESEWTLYQAFVRTGDRGRADSLRRAFIERADWIGDRARAETGGRRR